MGKKYIIEIEDEPFGRDDDMEHYLYRAKGFKSLVFDQEGLEKLVEFDHMRPSWYEEVYQRGLDAAWDVAKKLWLPSMRGGLSCREIDEIFGVEACSVKDIMEQYSASECIAKLKEYEQRKDHIEVGDEVAFQNANRRDTVVVVTYIGDDGYIDGMDGRGTQYAHKNPMNWTKTGRRFPELVEVLNKMKEDNNGIN